MKVSDVSHRSRWPLWKAEVVGAEVVVITVVQLEAEERRLGQEAMRGLEEGELAAAAAHYQSGTQHHQCSQVCVGLLARRSLLMTSSHFSGFRFQVLSQVSFSSGSAVGISVVLSS